MAARLIISVLGGIKIYSMPIPINGYQKEVRGINEKNLYLSHAPGCKVQ